MPAMFESKEDSERNSSSKDAGTQLRQQIGSLMVNATDWAEEHRRQLVFGSLAGIAGAIATLVRIHGMPGFTRITSNTQLAARLLRQQETRRGFASLRLPVLLAGFQLQDGRLLAEAVHYPVLLRWYDKYKGRWPTHMLPNMHTTAGKPNSTITASSTPEDAHTGGSSGSGGGSCVCSSATQLAPQPGTLYCYIAGIHEVHPITLQLLQQQVIRHPARVHSLRVFAMTQQHTSSSTTTSSSTSHTGSSSTSHTGSSSSSDDRNAAGETSTATTTSSSRHGGTFNLEQQDGSNSNGANQAPQQQQQGVQAPKHPAAAATAQLPSPTDFPQAASSDSSSAWRLGSGSSTVSSARHIDSTLGTHVPDDMLWAELWVLGGVPKPQLKAAAKSVSKNSSSSSSSSGTGVLGSYQSTAAAAAAVRFGWWPEWLVTRRKDLTEVLLKHGLARLAAPEDFEWLGFRAGAVRAYTRASEHTQAIVETGPVLIGTSQLRSAAAVESAAAAAAACGASEHTHAIPASTETSQSRSAAAAACRASEYAQAKSLGLHRQHQQAAAAGVFPRLPKILGKLQSWCKQRHR